MIGPRSAKAVVVLTIIVVISATPIYALTSPAQTSSAGTISDLCAKAHLASCDGICTSTQLDPNNCGACKHTCPPSDCNTFQFCLGGVCDALCLHGTSKCGAACVDFSTNTSNCAACGHVCPTPINGGATCSNGKCGIACAKNYASCSGQCVSLQTDVGNCGACGHLCQTTDPGAFPTCSAGTCSSPCRPGYTLCSGKCIATASDASNCGSCGKVISFSRLHCSFQQLAAVCMVSNGYTSSRSLLNL